MPTTDFDGPVRVLLSPNDKTKLHKWPCRKATVRFSDSKKVVHDGLQTNDDGVIDRVQLDPGTAYKVEVTSPGFELWQAGELTVEKAPKDVPNVWVTPVPPNCFFVLRLVTNRSEPVAGGSVTVTAEQAKFSETFTAGSEGYVYAVAPPGDVTLEFQTEDVGNERFCPRDFLVPYTVEEVADVDALEFTYWPAIEIVAAPTVTAPGTKATPLYGTKVTVEYRVSAQSVATSRTKTLTKPTDPTKPVVVCFEYPYPGEFMVTLTPPPTWADLPIEAEPAPARTATTLPPGSWQTLSPGPPWEVPAEFTVVPTEGITILVSTPDGQPLAGPPQFTISYEGGSATVTVDPATNKGTTLVPQDIPSEINLVAGTASIENTVSGSGKTYAAPLKMSDPGQTVVPGTNPVVLEYEYPLTIHARDDRDRPVTGAMVHIFDGHNNHVGEGITGTDGSFVIGVGSSGTYYASQSGGGLLESATVSSPGAVTVRIMGAAGEALTDLSAYPVLTEEVSTTGPPAPAAGGAGGGGGAGAGGGYGQTVNQAIRDVRGGRPSNDVTGFQAALTGAFQLRAVEGHTEWTWQQRGYSVQADMGALRGAQASIWARAKAALDQMQPLLAGVTALNPTLYPPEDLEAIRIVITAELSELVNELALEGGPRIQRVDELFRLLVGESRKSLDPNPDHVQGQLGTMRARFGLTEEWVDTIDQEQILTNFRVVVEQVLSLQESWVYDRKLLSVVDSDSSLGTILIWLSRGLEAVCESVDDLTFSLDSVYVDAAQRQVINIELPGQASMLLSDLLDWVVKAARDEGPKLIQDGGRDGVNAFAPVLRELRTLIEGTRRFSRTPNSTVPDGMRTPRVHRAFQVLEAQLIEASRLARLVEKQSHDQAPQITSATLEPAPPKHEAPMGHPGEIVVVMTGVNFRKNASAFLLPADREDVADVPARHTNVKNPSSATARFRIPRQGANGHGVTWQIAITNEDGTQSAPADIQIKPADIRQLP